MRITFYICREVFKIWDLRLGQSWFGFSGAHLLFSFMCRNHEKDNELWSYMVWIHHYEKMDGFQLWCVKFTRDDRNNNLGHIALVWTSLRVLVMPNTATLSGAWQPTSPLGQSFSWLSFHFLSNVPRTITGDHLLVAVASQNREIPFVAWMQVTGFNQSGVNNTIKSRPIVPFGQLGPTTQAMKTQQSSFMLLHGWKGSCVALH